MEFVHHQHVTHHHYVVLIVQLVLVTKVSHAKVVLVNALVRVLTINVDRMMDVEEYVQPVFVTKVSGVKVVLAHHVMISHHVVLIVQKVLVTKVSHVKVVLVQLL